MTITLRDSIAKQLFSNYMRDEYGPDETSAKYGPNWPYRWHDLSQREKVHWYEDAETIIKIMEDYNNAQT